MSLKTQFLNVLNVDQCDIFEHFFGSQPKNGKVKNKGEDQDLDR